MIHVRMELWPGGDRSRAQDLGSAEIANISDLADISSYSVRLLKGARYSPRNAGQVYKTGKVQAFPRTSRSWGPWELLYLALESAIGTRIVSLKRYLTSINERDRVEPRCTWTLDDEDYGAHSTSCGEYFQIEEGSPAENGMEFCCYCGRPIE